MSNEPLPSPFVAVQIGAAHLPDRGRNAWTDLASQAEVTNGEFGNLLVECGEHGLMIEPEIVLSILDRHQIQIPEEQLVQGLTAMLAGAGNSLISDNYGLSANFLQLAAFLGNMAIDRGNRAAIYTEEMRGELDELYRHACDSAIENSDVPEKVMKAVAIARWALDSVRSIGKEDGKFPEDRPTFLFRRS